MLPIFFMPKIIIIMSPKNSMLVHMMLSADVCRMPIMLIIMQMMIAMIAKSIGWLLPMSVAKYPPNPKLTVAALTNPVMMTKMPTSHAIFLLNAARV